MERQVPPIDLIRMLTEERQRLLRQSLTGFGIAMVGGLLVANSGSNPNVSIDINFVKLSVPVAYLNFFDAFVVAGSVMLFMSHMFVNEFHRIAVNRLLKFDNAPMIADLLGAGTAWSATALPQYRFLESNRSHRVFSLATMLFAVGPPLLVLAFLYLNVVGAALRSLRAEAPWSAAFSLAALFLVAYPIFHAIVSLVPFKFKKNTRFIRWSFLFPMHQKGKLVRPDAVKRWRGSSVAQ
jgi:hypothetical protein